MTKKVFWLPVYRKLVPANFETWMESLALEGWNVNRFTKFNSVKMAFRMTFYKTEPKKYRYVFDLKAILSKDYIRAYEQFGWEYVGTVSSFCVWRKEYTDVRPESFSDAESIVRRNRRVRNVVIAALIFYIAAVATGLVGIGVCVYVGKLSKIIEIVFGIAVLSALSGYCYWVVRQINSHLER